MLTGDAASQWKAMAALMPYNTTQGGAGYYIPSLYQALAQRTGDKARLLRAMTMGSELPGNRGATMTVPDLVALVGPAEAEKSLLAMLKTSTKPIASIQGSRTMALAQRLALANVKTMKIAQWALVSSPKAIRLYEAMSARFGVAKTAAGGYGSETQLASQARYYYMIGLLTEGREAQALKIAKTMGQSMGLGNYDDPALESLVGTPSFTRFLGELVKSDPKSPLWSAYIASATRSQNMPAVIATLNAALAKPKVDEGLAVLKKVIAEPGPARDSEGAVRLMSAIQYTKIGQLLGRPAVVEEGLAAARKSAPDEATMIYMGADSSVVSVLLDLGRSAEAEKMAIAAYVASGEMADQLAMMSDDRANPSLLGLAQLYYRLNRPEDVRALLDKAPDWGVSDLADLAQASPYGYNSGGPSSGFVAAWALAKTGEPVKAEALLYRVLASTPGYDPAYRLLVEMKGIEALPILDRLFTADQFQERPMIWKAVVLKDAGRLEEAETTIRQAIAIDPSDGETRDGHRLYAYSVLADIREARGDAGQAKDYREAVAAIRIAEKADELAGVGLITRALATYEESLRRFSNAYCIQSRLAVQLMQEGRTKEAEEHYRRAYQLMPESFGRVETHCMGCEGVFAGKLAQEIAEETFVALAKETPNKPQVHYLLGYLRESQDRYSEALASYNRAVELDPDYLNAWKELASLSTMVTISPERQNAISAAILRLDPLQKHGHDRNGSMGGDLKELWRLTEKALAAQGTQGTSTIAPLPASAARLEKLRSTREAMMGGRSWSNEDYSGAVASGGAAVARNGVMSILVQLIGNAEQMPGMATE
ncbi:tetratricopeptide repeat protein [bacterium]|nr:MAG: tetratricopeptide repeat protein [bacterium]